MAARKAEEEREMVKAEEKAVYWAATVDKKVVAHSVEEH